MITFTARKRLEPNRNKEAVDMMRGWKMGRWNSVIAGMFFCMVCLDTVPVSATADPADYQIVMVAKQYDPWFDDMETGVVQLKKDTGLNVSMQYPETSDANGQIYIMEELIEQGVDAICIVPNDPDALLNVVAEARNAGIVVVTHEAPSIAEKVDLDVEAFVNEKFGRLFGENIASSMNGSGRYAGIVGSRKMDTHMEWYEAAVNYITEKYPDMVCVSEEPFEDGNSEEGAYAVTQKILEEHPDIDGIFDCSAYGGGVCKALIEKNLSGDVKVVSLAIPSETGKYLEDGSMTSILAWRPADAGYATCYAAYLLASGQTVENGTDLKMTGYESIRVKEGIAYGDAPLEYTLENIEDYGF